MRQPAPLASRPLEQAVIAPWMLFLLHPLDAQIDGCAREAFLDDLVDQAEADVRGAFAARASRVSIDLNDRVLAHEVDRDRVYRLVGERSRDDGDGVAQGTRTSARSSGTSQACQRAGGHHERAGQRDRHGQACAHHPGLLR